jgi:hypothetical protein
MKTLFAIALTLMVSAAHGGDEKPLARLGSHGPYPACEQPSELDSLLEMRARNKKLQYPSDCTEIASGTEVRVWELKKSNDKNLGSLVLVRLPDGYKLPNGIAHMLWVQASAIVQ